MNQGGRGDLAGKRKRLKSARSQVRRLPAINQTSSAKAGRIKAVQRRGGSGGVISLVLTASSCSATSKTDIEALSITQETASSIPRNGLVAKNKGACHSMTL